MLLFFHEKLFLNIFVSFLDLDGDANAGEIYQTSSTSTSASSAQSSTTSTTTPSTTTTATTTEKPLNKSNSTFDASFWDVLRQQPATSATSNTQAQAQPKPEEFNDPTLPKDPPPVEQRVVPQTLIGTEYFQTTFFSRRKPRVFLVSLLKPRVNFS